MISTEEFARELGVTANLVRKKIEAGVVEATLVGKTWCIHPSQLKDPQIVFDLVKNAPNQKRKPKRSKKKSSNKKPICLSFFSGAMGLDLGLEEAGFETLLSCEIDRAARKTILLNRPEIGLIDDINNFSAAQIRQFAGIDEKEEIHLVAGGPPCQAFSTAGKRKGFEDDRGNVFLTFLDRIIELNPKYFLIENVRGLLSAKALSADGLPLQAIEQICTRLKDAGYSVSYNLYNAANYGSPQKRERVIILGKRGKRKLPYLKPTHHEEGLFGLPQWVTFEDVYVDEESPEHINFPEKRVRYYKKLGPGQNWRNLPEKLQKEALGNSYFSGGGKTGFYRRLAWDKPSPTLVTHPAMPATDLCHPELNRPLSVGEYASIQEFPRNWNFFGSTIDKYKQIGNAVPVKLGLAAGKVIMNDLNDKTEHPPEGFRFSRYKNTSDLELEVPASSQISLFDEHVPV